MDARTIDSTFQLPQFTPHLSSNAPVFTTFSKLPELQGENHLGALRGLLYAIGFQCVFGLICFAGWGLWHLLR